MKQKDLLVLGAFLLIGITGYVFFFTDVVTSMFGIESTDTNSTNVQSKNGFERFNTDVEKQEVQEFASKEEAYRSEYEQSKSDALEQERLSKLKESKAELYKEGTGVNDLTAMMGKSKRTQENSTDIEVNNGETETSKKINPTTTTKTVKKSTTTKATSKGKPAPKPQNRVRVRKEDPEFGDGTEVSEYEVNEVIQGVGEIHKEQIITARSSVIVRVTEEFSVNGCDVKKNTFLTGYVNFNQYSRAEVLINGINCNGQIIDVELALYDGYDGLEGIAIKGRTDEQEVGKEVTGEVVGETANKLGIPILGRAISSEANKKANKISVKLNSGHKVYIKIVE